MEQSVPAAARRRRHGVGGPASGRRQLLRRTGSGRPHGAPGAAGGRVATRSAPTPAVVISPRAPRGRRGRGPARRSVHTGEACPVRRDPRRTPIAGSRSWRWTWRRQRTWSPWPGRDHLRDRSSWRRTRLVAWALRHAERAQPLTERDTHAARSGSSTPACRSLWSTKRSSTGPAGSSAWRTCSTRWPGWSASTTGADHRRARRHSQDVGAGPRTSGGSASSTSPSRGRTCLAATGSPNGSCPRAPGRGSCPSTSGPGPSIRLRSWPVAPTLDELLAQRAVMAEVHGAV